MVSDHAEKLLDVWDVLHGQTSIFFPRNTGREAIQMYLTAGIIQLFHTGYTFLSLKIGTILAGLLTLPFIYLLGKELANRRVGLLALLFAGIGILAECHLARGAAFPALSIVCCTHAILPDPRACAPPTATILSWQVWPWGSACTDILPSAFCRSSPDGGGLIFIASPGQGQAPAGCFGIAGAGADLPDRLPAAIAFRPRISHPLRLSRIFTPGHH